MRQLFKAPSNTIIDHLIERMHALTRTAALRRLRRSATVDPTATLHPECEIVNSGATECIRVGPHTHVRGQLLTFWNGGRISLGRFSYVGAGSRIWSQTRVDIGDYVLISHLVDIHDTDGHPLDWRARREDWQSIATGHGRRLPAAAAPVVVEADVWIGFKVSILKGVRIGRGAIVAAGSVVTHDIPAWSLVAGNPARVVRQLPSDDHGPERST